jgi:membrane protein DedA with SNARE-associated domain
MKPAWLIGAVAASIALFLLRRKLERATLVIGLAVVAAMAVYGTGVVALPDLAELLEDLGRTLGPWTYLLVGLMAFLEAAAFVGLFVPGETTIVVGGVVAGQGEIDIILLIAIAWSMAVLGDLTGYLLGRRLGRPFLARHGPRFGLGENRIEQAEKFFADHGGKAIFIGRFVGLVRSLAPFLAGSSRMPLGRFIPYDVLGAGIQSTLLCLVGYFFWQSLDTVLEFVERGALALGVTIAVVAGIVVAVRWLRDPANRHSLVRWFEDRQDHRLARWALWLGRKSRQPGRFLLDRLTPGELGLEFTSLLALASVGSFVFFGYLIALDPGELTPGDERGRVWSDAIRAGALDDLMRVIESLGALPLAATALVITAAALIAARHVLEGAALIGGLLLTMVAIYLTKGALWATGPAHWPAEGLMDRAAAPGGISPTYPSAVAAYSVAWVAIAVALRHAFARLAQIATVLVLALMLSAGAALAAVYLGNDWFSDAAGGLGLGVFAYSLAGAIAVAVTQLAPGDGARSKRRQAGRSG